MDNNEAIWRLKDHFRIHDDGRPTPKLDKAVDMAIEALEKTTPKKPNWVYNDEPLCPNCGGVLDDSDPVCEYCHQLLDWSE